MNNTLDIVLYPEFGDSWLKVNSRFVSDFHREILINTGYVQKVLYPNSNDFPHTVGSLLVVGTIRIDCLNGDTPEAVYQRIQMIMQEVTEILQIAELGGSPNRYRAAPKTGNLDSRNSTEKLGVRLGLKRSKPK